MRLRRRRPVEEQRAEGEIAVIFHDVRQTLRVNGVGFPFCTWASFPGFLPTMWEALRPVAETRAFEEAADELRAEAVRAALSVGTVAAFATTDLGPSQSHQLRAALDLYHYASPKLLLFAAKLERALRAAPGAEVEARAAATAGPGDARVVRGVPPRMAPMEVASEHGADRELRAAFAEIKRVHRLEAAAGLYRALALWPDYLLSAWHELRLLLDGEAYRLGLETVAQRARTLAAALPGADLGRRRLGEAADEHDEILEATARVGRALLPQTLDVALLVLELGPPERAAASPYPATFHGPSREPAP